MTDGIKSIKRNVPFDEIEDGRYEGVQGGYVVEMLYGCETLELHTKDGVRGFGIDVIVTVKDGIFTIE